MTHQERELMSSRHSFLRSHFHALLCEGKEDLLEIRRQVVPRALARSCGEYFTRALGDGAPGAGETQVKRRRQTRPCYTGRRVDHGRRLR
jgi:hypothetical protein